MIKYYCDKCEKELEEKNVVFVESELRNHPLGGILINLLGNKEYCQECYKKAFAPQLFTAEELGCKKDESNLQKQLTELLEKYNLLLEENKALEEQAAELRTEVFNLGENLRGCR